MADNQNVTSSPYARYGPWAVVTGASSGIGQALAEHLAGAGLHLVLVARNLTLLEQQAAQYQKRYSIQTRVVGLDLSAPSADAALQKVTADLDVGLLIASAGFGTAGSFLNGELSDELNMLAVNCRALTAAAWHFGRRFAQRGGGGMVLLSSIVGFNGVPNAAHYAATKAYVQSLAEALHQELKPQGIDVLAAAPGPVNTGFAARADMQMGNVLKPADLAKPIMQALGRKTTVFPGFLSKLLIYSLATAPRWGRIRILAQVMRGMTKHQASS